VGVASDALESDLKVNFRENGFFRMMYLSQQSRDATEAIGRRLSAKISGPRAGSLLTYVLLSAKQNQ
jgi:hypothetical protein